MLRLTLRASIPRKSSACILFVPLSLLTLLAPLSGCSGDEPSGGSGGSGGSAGSSLGGAGMGGVAGGTAGAGGLAGGALGGGGAGVVGGGGAGGGGSGGGSGGNAGMGGSSGGGGAGGGAAIEASFATVKGIVERSCFGAPCHNEPGNPLQMKLDDTLYTTLTTHMTKNCGPVIKSGSPQESALVKLLKGPCGKTDRMPLNKCFDDGDEGCIAPDYIAAIEQWIAKGAPK